jgi:hypothetical protein
MSALLATPERGVDMRERRIAEDENPVLSSTQLARVFDRVTEGRASCARLHAAIGEYVVFLRDAGLPPEKVLIAVKRALGYDELGYRLPNAVQAPVITRAITECIRRYYGPVAPH